MAKKSELLTEQAYIDVRDLSSILNAGAILRSMAIENQPNIPTKEYREVMKRLYEWQEKLFEAIKIHRDATEDMLDDCKTSGFENDLR